MPRIRLAYITHGLGANGIENLLVHVASQMDRERFDVTFIVAIDPETPTLLYEPQILALGMRVIRICDLDGFSKKRRYFHTLFEIFSREKFDVVHANMDLLNGLVLTAAKKAGIENRICHAHTSGTQYLTGKRLFLKKIIQKVYRTAMRCLIRRAATKKLGCSELANRYMYGRANAEILLNGVDLHAFAEARETHDLAADLAQAHFHLSAVGRISMPKNPIFLCEIIKELSMLRQDFILHWAGTGDLAQQVRDTIQKLDIEPYVQLLGVRTDIPQIMATCDFFLMPSLFEGLPVVLIEAQAAGLTCFVSDTTSRQVDAGGCSYLSLDLGAKEWAKAIDTVLRDNAHRPIADPKRLADFDIRSFTKKLEEIYACQ